MFMYKTIDLQSPFRKCGWDLLFPNFQINVWTFIQCLFFFTFGGWKFWIFVSVCRFDFYILMGVIYFVTIYRWVLLSVFISVLKFCLRKTSLIKAEIKYLFRFFQNNDETSNVGQSRFFYVRQYYFQSGALERSESADSSFLNSLRYFYMNNRILLQRNWL